MKKIISVLILGLALLGCGKDDKNKKTEIIYRKGIVYTLDSKGPFTGEGASYYGKDHLESEGYAKDGKQEGEWKYYYYNGQLKEEGSFIYGKRTGEWTFYAHNGSLKGKSIYINGQEQE